MANAFSLSPAGDHNLPPQSLFCSPLGGGLLREGGGEGARSRQMAGGLPVGGAGGSPAFTASQYEELQVQALIYKHLLMGVPVPQELLLSVRRSLESMATRLYNPHPFGYYSYFGKKFDPEPGRCRRTDGKKWRCSKDAYPDSKYCERHMHRGRNRSRKPVESPPLLSQAQPPPTAAGSIMAESLAPSMNGSGGGSSSCSSSLQSIHMHSLASTQVPFSSAQIESASSGLSSKEFRYPYQVKPELGQHSFFSESSTGSAKGLGMDSTLDNPWTVMPSQMSLFPLSKMTNSYPQLSPVDNLGQATMSSLSKQDQVPHSFFGGELGAVESAKQGQSLHPFMDDWPKTRTSWPDLEGGRSNLNSYSTTELSISIPMASSDFSSSSSRTPNGTSS